MRTAICFIFIMIAAGILDTAAPTFSGEVLNIFFPTRQNNYLTRAGVVIVLISSVTALGTPHKSLSSNMAEEKTAKNKTAVPEIAWKITADISFTEISTTSSSASII